MLSLRRLLVSILTTLVLASWCNATASAQTLPDHVGEIAEGVYSYGPPGEHYFSMFVVTDEGVIAIESVNTEHAKGFLRAIRAVTDQPLKYMLHSHNHWDHASGGQVFKDAGATTVAHVDAYEWMKAHTGPDMAVPDESWSGNRKDITLGGTTIELHYLGLNHGLGMTVFVLPQPKVAYVADLVTPNRVLFNIVPDFNIKQWERSLEEILKLDFDKGLYSHSEKTDALQGGTKQDVTDTLQYIRDLRAAVYAEFKKGTDPFMVPGIVRLPKYKDWSGYDQWLEMNAWRVMLDDWMGPFPWRPDPARH